ncbi:methyltransferase-domain-containing protein [Chaetomium strumarium]|uniref:Ribosomal RNA-processing protein 8 n=1 Tax=Chaetomium strumarium TaxID=1170767 RepID=A0AAJ0M2J4_9PEZI|nr:methyltransferase-domain-containing protein [Chaetomium strumarium]
MFPVKGLSISAEKLKVETERATTASAPKPSRKRKRQGNTENVTAANFADLWEKVIEHKKPSAPADQAQSKKDHKRQKREHESRAPASAAVGTASSAQLGSEGQQKQASDKFEKKQRKKEKRKQEQASLAAVSEPAEKDEWNGIDDEEEVEDAPEAAQAVVNERAEEKNKKTKRTGDDAKRQGQHQRSTDKARTAETAPPPAPPAPAPAKLTPLQASMREKLISARFRHLNETLYTRPSTEAYQLFLESPEMFTEYHEGFRRQVDVWPENPVDGYIADIKSRAKVRFPPRNRDQAPAPSQLPLPKAPGSKTCTIADLGCGDAKLATALQPLQSKLKLDIRSFDLQTGGSPLVTRADIANLPLPDGSVDVAIFCLALMGTNWIDFVEEAYRVLRWRGELWVAEIKSRFTNPALSTKKKSGVVAHSVGNRKKGAAASKGKRADEEDEAELAAELAVQVDGVAKQQQETDISAFLEALRKRGFLLNRDLGENAVDMRNKMFVRMHFVKAAPAVKGKCAVEDKEQGQDQSQRHGWKGKRDQGGPKKKFIGDDEDEAVNEAAVLKPCVYKIR